jgi:hypothetical protein
MLVSKTILTNKSIKMKWISIKDELPKDDGMYMTFTKSPRTESIGINMYDSEEKQFPSSFTTHWMPLPPQPNEESNVSSQEPAVHGIFPIAAQLCTEEQFQKRYYPCRCEKCGWQGCSCYLRVERYYEGDADIYCPNCDSTEIEDTNNDIFFLPNNPDATASKEIGEPLVQNKSNQ